MSNYQQARRRGAAYPNRGRAVLRCPFVSDARLHTAVPDARLAQGKNWSASGGTFHNGNGAPIANPGAYFSAVASNAKGFNGSYSNGHGQAISNPGAYYSAVCGPRGAASRLHRAPLTRTLRIAELHAVARALFSCPRALLSNTRHALRRAAAGAQRRVRLQQK